MPLPPRQRRVGGISMTVFVSDTFTDNDGTSLTDHSPETGEAWQFRGGEDSAEIKNDTMEPSSDGSSH